MADRKYDDKEVGRILKLAAEMQSGLSQSGDSDGLTLAELQRVADEIGIDPGIVSRAANEIDSSPKAMSRYKADSMLLEQSLAGELTDEGWDELVSEMRRFCGKPGKSELQGSTHEWTGASDTQSLMLCAVNRNGRTQLKLHGDNSGGTSIVMTIGVIFMILLPLTPVMFASKIHPSLHPLVIFAMSATVFGICLLTSLMTAQRRRNQFASQIKALMSRVCELAESNLSKDLLETRQSTPNWSTKRLLKNNESVSK